MAAIIPPKADYNEEETYNTNFSGTKNLIDAVLATGGARRCKFIHIGSVAEYGNRTPLHPFGRVGDPLMPSTFDIYASTKVKAERLVIESELEHWVVLRQTGVLYDEILMHNMDDGLMFHTPLNCPIEWTTAKDSAILIKNLIDATESGSLKNSNFYRNIYNIGGGLKMRCTGYETLDEGFRLMGSSVKKMFKPEWVAKRNFHCMYFLDSHILEDLFHFQNTSFIEFFASLKKRYWYFKLAKPFSFLVKFFTIRPLLKQLNSPTRWKEEDVQRYNVFCSSKNGESSCDSWDECQMLCNKKRDGNELSYDELKKEELCKVKFFHGYDDEKRLEELDIEDVKMAARFRGGHLLDNQTMKKGDVYTKLKWKCHNGHIFCASPFLIMRGGHWCPECTDSPPWKWGELAKNIPFYAQSYYDSFSKEERESYEWHPLR